MCCVCLHTHVCIHLQQLDVCLQHMDVCLHSQLGVPLHTNIQESLANMGDEHSTAGWGHSSIPEPLNVFSLCYEAARFAMGGVC